MLQSNLADQRVDVNKELMVRVKLIGFTPVISSLWSERYSFTIGQFFNYIQNENGKVLHSIKTRNSILFLFYLSDRLEAPSSLNVNKNTLELTWTAVETTSVSQTLVIISGKDFNKTFQLQPGKGLPN